MGIPLTMTTRLHSVALLIVLLLSGTMASAQRSTWNWYFGSQAGLTFRSGTAEVLRDGAIRTSEGSASVSDDVQGDLLFYTNGRTVWNRLHEIMADGTDLAGDESTSQTLIVPNPGNPFLYYIFNTAPITSANIGARCFCLTMNVVDLRRENGYGQVIAKNQVLFDDVEITEHITATADCQGTGTWVVVRSRSTRDFYAFRVTRDRVEPVPVKSDASNPQLVVRDAGQMHISPDGRHLIVTSVAGNTQLYDFDPATGLITNGLHLAVRTPGVTIPEPGAHYGAAFSHDSRYAYFVVTTDGPANIYRIPTSVESADDVDGALEFVAAMPAADRWVPMQLGPDRRIYIGKPNEAALGVMERPWRSEVDSVLVRDRAILLPSGRVENGLPNMIGSSIFPQQQGLACSLPTAGISIVDGCAGGCVAVTDNSTGSIDSWEWSFPNGQPTLSTARNPGQVCFREAGTVTVRLIVRNASGADTAFTTIRIQPRPTVTTSPDVDICQGASAPLRANGAVRYRWAPAAFLDDPTSATPVATVTTSTVFTVIGTAANGCSDTATVRIGVIDMKAGANQTVCRGGAARLSATGAHRYSWTPAADLDDPTVATPTARPTATTDYIVRMERDSCVVYDTVTVTVVDAFTITATGPAAICSGSDAVLRVTGATGSISWTPANVLDDPTSATPRARPDTTTTFIVTVRNGSCLASDTITVIVHPTPTVIVPSAYSACSGDIVTMTAVATPGASLVWSPTAGLDDPTSSTPRLTVSTSQTYTVTATSPEGCTSAASVDVVARTSITASAGPDRRICAGGAVQLSGSTDAGTIRWEPPTGLSDPTSVSPIASPATTTTYVIIATAGSCESRDTMTVFVSALNQLSITPDTSICPGDRVRLIANASATRWIWTPADGLSDATASNPLASPSETTIYTVRAIDDFAGCEQTAIVTVRVLQGTPMVLRMSSATAVAGAENVALPIFVEVDESLLPLRIDTLRAEVVIERSIFVPKVLDRGVVSEGVVGGVRTTYLLMNNVVLTQPVQRLTTMRGQTLLGDATATPVRWGKVDVQGPARCADVTPMDGSIAVTGCNLPGRFFRLFSSATATVQVTTDALTVTIGGSATGEHTVQVFDGMGTLVNTIVTARTENSPSEVHILDARPLANGIYYVRMTDPFGSAQVVPVVLIR